VSIPNGNWVLNPSVIKFKTSAQEAEKFICARAIFMNDGRTSQRCLKIKELYRQKECIRKGRESGAHYGNTVCGLFSRKTCAVTYKTASELEINHRKVFGDLEIWDEGMNWFDTRLTLPFPPQVSTSTSLSSLNGDFLVIVAQRQEEQLIGGIKLDSKSQYVQFMSLLVEDTTTTTTTPTTTATTTTTTTTTTTDKATSPTSTPFAFTTADKAVAAAARARQWIRMIYYDPNGNKLTTAGSKTLVYSNGRTLKVTDLQVYGHFCPSVLSSPYAAEAILAPSLAAGDLAMNAQNMRLSRRRLQSKGKARDGSSKRGKGGRGGGGGDLEGGGGSRSKKKQNNKKINKDDDGGAASIADDPTSASTSELKFMQGVEDKNWSPFVYQGKLLWSYEIRPHVVCSLDLDSPNSIYRPRPSTAPASSPYSCALCIQKYATSAGQAVNARGERVYIDPLWAKFDEMLQSRLKIEKFIPRDFDLSKLEVVVHLNGVPSYHIPSESSYLGIGHAIVRLHTDDDPMLISTYETFFYLLSDTPPFAVTGLSCPINLIKKPSIGGVFNQSERFRNVAFVSGFNYDQLSKGSELLISYGIGDYQSHIITMNVRDAFEMFDFCKACNHCTSNGG